MRFADIVKDGGISMALILIIVIAVFIILAFLPQNSDYVFHNNNKPSHEVIDQNRDRIYKELESISFKESKEIYLTLDSISPKMKIDTVNQRIAFCDYYKNTLKVIPFKTLLECEIIDDDTTVLSGGIGRAIVGGAIAGGAGAVVGAATRKSKTVTNNLSIKIITSDINDSLIVIPILETSTNRASEKFKKAWSVAQEVHAAIVSIIKTTSTASSTTSTLDPLSQIEMLAKLKDEGILTEEEYSKKKSELLAKV